jgi:hypothetical protein
MKRRSRDQEREQRITMEIIVDAYTRSPPIGSRPRRSPALPDTHRPRRAGALRGGGQGRQGSHSLSSSSVCLVRGAVVTCSCWNRNRSAVLSLIDSVWLPAANTTISCWSTSGST